MTGLLDDGHSRELEESDCRVSWSGADRVDPKVLLPSRPDLRCSRQETQRRLLLDGVARYTPVKATSAGVIFDGHHIVRAAAEEGMLIDVSIIGIAQAPVGEVILDLPVR